MLLEAAPESVARPSAVDRPLHLLTISGKSHVALNQLAGRYARYMANQKAAWPDICYTANTGRSHQNYRLALVAESAAEAQTKLAAVAEGKVQPGVTVHETIGTEQPEVVFLFTGQGAQYEGMGRQLYESQPTFRQTLTECDELLRSDLDQPLLSVLYPRDETSKGLLDKTEYTQPALFALEYALAQLWRSWGIEPAAVMGHSVGEYVAACVAGVFSLKDGLKLIATRARLMQALPQNGVMTAVFVDDDIANALSILPDDFRTIVFLSDIEGYTYEEIADFMDCPIGTVRSRLHRARKMLYALLINYAQDNGYVKIDHKKNPQNSEKTRILGKFGSKVTMN
jgi:acyl transferase domain-containing protein